VGEDRKVCRNGHRNKRILKYGSPNQQGKYELVIQDFLTTNRKLDELSISYQGLSAVNKEALAKAIERVDAVIYLWRDNG
jgi:hypothetical protein